MLTLKTIKMWSNEAKAIVDFDISFETEVDEGDNKHEVVMLKHEDEILRVSPNAQDADLEKMAKEANEGH